MNKKLDKYLNAVKSGDRYTTSAMERWARKQCPEIDSLGVACQRAQKMLDKGYTALYEGKLGARHRVKLPDEGIHDSQIMGVLKKLSLKDLEAATHIGFGPLNKHQQQVADRINEELEAQATIGGIGLTGRIYRDLSQPEPVKKSILDTAKEIIYGEREQTYGDPSKNLKTIADFWQTYLYHKYGAGFPMDVNDVCALMRLLKEARLINTPTHIDSLVDLAGYSALQERVMK